MSKSAVMNSRKPSNSTTPQGAVAGVNDYEKLHIGRELADTTWRIAVPVVLLAGLGIMADRNLGSQPWLTMLGVMVGFVVAGWLIKRQLNRWPAPLPKPGSYERNRKTDDEEKDYYND